MEYYILFVFNATFKPFNTKSQFQPDLFTRNLRLNEDNPKRVETCWSFDILIVSYI